MTGQVHGKLCMPVVLTIGYQETDTFFERLADGDSTMGRDGQQNHALNHILPYLNLSLKGDDSAYQAAFNREDKSVSSDVDSYIDEDLFPL